MKREPFSYTFALAVILVTLMGIAMIGCSTQSPIAPDTNTTILTGVFDSTKYEDGDWWIGIPEGTIKIEIETNQGQGGWMTVEELGFLVMVYYDSPPSIFIKDNKRVLNGWNYRVVCER